MRSGAAELQRGLGRDWFDVRDPADAIGAENLARLFHGLTETRRRQFVNGKVWIGIVSSRGCGRL